MTSQNNQLTSNSILRFSYSFILSGIIVIAGSLFTCCTETTENVSISRYPAGYDFAFTITDDPDEGRIEQKKAVYDYLDSIGMKISIGVWVFKNKRGSGNLSYYDQGISLENDEFLQYVRRLKEKGFELFVHTVSGGNDLRQETISGFHAYQRYFGAYPEHWVNHFTNLENIYWGYKRFNNPVMSFLYKTFKTDQFSGDDQHNQYFWGDYCQKYIKYVRGWATPDINTLKFNPSMPYHDPNKPYVRFWYACSDGANREMFNRLISRENVDRLIREKGTSIIYTHFASGFVDKNGTLNEETAELLRYLASHNNGWFVPVNVILDRFIAIRSIKIYEDDDRYLLVNTSGKTIENIAVEVRDKDGVLYKDMRYKPMVDAPSIITLDKLPGNTSISLLKISPGTKRFIPFKERVRLSASWLLSRFY